MLATKFYFYTNKRRKYAYENVIPVTARSLFIF
jgi:hypothetical protein